MELFDIKTEDQIIVNALCNDKSLEYIMENVNKNLFYAPDNEKLIQIISDMYINSKEINTVSVNEKYKSLYGINIKKYIIDQSPIPSYTKELVNKIKDLKVLRDGLHILEDLKTEIKSNHDHGRLKELMFKKVSEIQEIEEKSSSRNMRTIGQDVLTNIDKRSKGFTGLKTGYKDLDDHIIGFKKGQLIVIAARPSMGKSQFASCILDNISSNDKKSSLYFSLEMDDTQVMDRLISKNSGVDYYKFHTGIMSEEESIRIVDTVGKMSSDCKIYIDDTPRLTIDEICKRIKINKRKHKIEIAVIDHLGLIEMNERNSRHLEIAHITRKLKIAAKTLDIPIILISQLNRDVEKEKDKIPHLSDLRDSGAIEQDADIVMMLYREDYYNKESPKKNICEVFIRKNRDGKTGNIELLFLRNQMKFQDIEKHGEYIITK